MLRNVKRSFCLLLTIFLISVRVYAQMDTGSIQGIVLDQQDAAVPGVEITARNVGTNVTFNAVTNESGFYKLTPLVIGEYEVRASLPGFKTRVRSGIKLEVQAVIRLDFTLEVGEITDSITVTGAASLLERETSSTGQVIETETINDLPLNGRNDVQLSLLTVGVVEPPRGDRGGISGFVANGVRATMNDYKLDEFLRERRGLTNITHTLPGAAEQKGDFSAGPPIFDSATVRPNPGGEGFIRDPFPNNVIPSERIDPVSARVTELLPLPNLPGRTVNNFFVSPVNRIDPDSHVLSGSRPNIIVIMTDDLDGGMVTDTWRGGTFELALELKLLPNIKRYLVDQGIHFTESFVTNPVCCPSRATFLSGQYTHNHNTFSNMPLNGMVTAFDDSSSVATWLQAGGYRTGHVGKYLNAYGGMHEFGGSEEDLAEAREWALQTAPDSVEKFEPDYIPPGWDEWYGLLDLSTYCNFNYSINERGIIKEYIKDGQINRYDYFPNGTVERTVIRPPIDDGRLHYYQTDVLSAHAVRFIRNAEGNDSQPFFLALLPLAPHVERCNTHDPDGPNLAWEVYKDQFRDTIRPAPRHEFLVNALKTVVESRLNTGSKPSFNEPNLEDKPKSLADKLDSLDSVDSDNLYRQYAGRLASLMAVDNMIGRLVRELFLRGELNKTVVIFTSDNGWFNGEHRLSSKLLPYEEAVRVPLYVRIPTSLSPQERSQTVPTTTWHPRSLTWPGSNRNTR